MERRRMKWRAIVLSSLLVTMLIGAGLWLQRQHEERTAVAHLEALGGYVGREPFLYYLNRDTIAARFIELTKVLPANFQELAEDVISKILPVGTVVMLNDRKKVTDSDLKHLRSISDLQALFLTNTQITDAGLKHLANHPELRILELSGTQVTDAGLQHLDNLPRLKGLFLKNTQVTPGRIAGFKNAAPDVLLIQPYVPPATDNPEG